MKDDDALIALRNAAQRAQQRCQYRVSVSPSAILRLFQQRDQAVEVARKWVPKSRPTKPRAEI